MSTNPVKTTEDAILEAAETLFLEKGYAKTSTVQIAKVVGCNQALVHYYFRTKENLFRQIFERKINLFVGSLLEISDPKLPFEEKLKRRISAHFDMLKLNKKLPILLFYEVSTNPEMAEKMVAQIRHLPLFVVQQIQSELDTEFENGNICKTDAKLLLFSIFSMNVMTFISAPVFRLLTNATDEQFERLLKKRKAENIKFILKSLKP